MCDGFMDNALSTFVSSSSKLYVVPVVLPHNIPPGLITLYSGDAYMIGQCCIIKTYPHKMPSA